jgi:hypothetical protein
MALHGFSNTVMAFDYLLGLMQTLGVATPRLLNE